MGFYGRFCPIHFYGRVIVVVVTVGVGFRGWGGCFGDHAALLVVVTLAVWWLLEWRWNGGGGWRC
jgi:hypothetical protein